MTDQNRPDLPHDHGQPAPSRRAFLGHHHLAPGGDDRTQPLADRPTLIITRGLPGSGKTEWAKTLGHTRVNRDCLRDALHGARDHTPEHERQITIAQHAAVAALLRDGTTVVVDDTNIPLKHVMRWEDLAERCGAWLVVADQFLRVPAGECISRQDARPEHERVPAQVIERMAAEIHSQAAVQAGNPVPGEPPVPQAEAVVYWPAFGTRGLAGGEDGAADRYVIDGTRREDAHDQLDERREVLYRRQDWCNQHGPLPASERRIVVVVEGATELLREDAQAAVVVREIAKVGWKLRMAVELHVEGTGLVDVGGMDVLRCSGNVTLVTPDLVTAHAGR